MENWKPVAGYEGSYEVSDAGRVRGVSRLDSRGRRRAGKMRSLNQAISGHLNVTLCKDGVQRSYPVHHLVLLAFVGPRPEGLEGCHWNDDPSDNRLSNLRWGTRSENQLDSVRNGTHFSASKRTCPAGHPYSPDNTYSHPSGRRCCRECRSAQRRARRSTQQRKAVA